MASRATTLQHSTTILSQISVILTNRPRTATLLARAHLLLAQAASFGLDWSSGVSTADGLCLSTNLMSAARRRSNLRTNHVRMSSKHSKTNPEDGIGCCTYSRSGFV